MKKKEKIINAKPSDLAPVLALPIPSLFTSCHQLKLTKMDEYFRQNVKHVVFTSRLQRKCKSLWWQAKEST